MGLEKEIQNILWQTQQIKSSIESIISIDKDTKKDNWDKVGAIAPIIAAVIIASIGGLATAVYEYEKTENLRIMALEKFSPYLQSQNPQTRDIGLTAIKELTDGKTVVPLAATVETKKLIDWLDDPDVEVAKAARKELGVVKGGLSKTVKINKSGSPVQMNIFFGQLQYGAYEISLHDEKGGGRKKIKSGNNLDEHDDTFLLGEPSSLINQTLSWVFTIAATDDSADPLYLARVTIMQDGNVLNDSPFEYSGSLLRAKVVTGVARISAIN